MSAYISTVKPNSPAYRAGIKPQSKLVSVNKVVPRDLIELSFLTAEEELTLVTEDALGVRQAYFVQKDLDEDVGLSYETAVFEGTKLCHNHCVFCFVDQMRRGLRPSLYVKDDDYRLSFLYGNFITLTNLTEADYQRIIREHLSPLYISVHATDGAVRERMMGNKKAGELMERLRYLAQAGIEFHAQIVLCPEYNDGAVLKSTLQDLLSLMPALLSLAIVPVGLTAARERLTPLRLFTAQEATNLIAEVESWQKACQKRYGRKIVFLSDEFYILAERPLPEDASYEGYPQLENGIGLSRLFLTQWEKARVVSNAHTLGRIAIVTGISAAKVLSPLVAAFNAEQETEHFVLPVVNSFFGEMINVTGLLTAGDIARTLAKVRSNYDHVALPAKVLNSDDLFLDGVTRQAFLQSLGCSCSFVGTGAELKQLLSR